MRNRNKSSKLKQVICSISLALCICTIAQGRFPGQTRSLQPDTPVLRDLRGGEIHSYRINLKASEYFHVEVEQRGIDVLLNLVGTDGKTIFTRDRPNGTRGTEVLSFIATSAGDYRLEVKARDEKAKAGKYEIKSDLPHTPTVQDKNQIEAETLFQEGLRLSQSKTADAVAQACEKYEAAARLWLEIEDQYAEALTQTNLGNDREILREYEKAAAAHERALWIYRKLKDRRNEASSLSSLCALNVYLVKAEAVEQYLQAREIYQDLKDANGEKRLKERFGEAVTVYRNVGIRILQHQSEEMYQFAFKIFKISQLLFFTLEDKENEVITLLALGFINDRLGDKQEAINYYDKALLLSREIRNKSLEANTLSNIGSVYLDLGDYQKALGYLNQAAVLLEKGDDKFRTARTLSNIGFIYSGFGDHQKALDYLNQALAFYKDKDVADKRGEAATLVTIGGIYSALGEKQNALDYYNQALSLYKATWDKDGEATALNNIGLAYSDSGDTFKALDYYNQALIILKIVGNKQNEAMTLNNISRIWFNSRKTRLAVFYNKQSVNEYQQLRANNQELDKESQKTFIKSVEYTYRNLVDLLVEQARLAEAQQVINAFKDQQYFDFNADTLKNPSLLSLTQREKELTARYDAAGDKIGIIGGKIGKLKLLIEYGQASEEESDELQHLENDLKTVSDEFLAVLKQAETEFTKTTDEKDKVGEVPDTIEMQASLRELSKNGQKAVAVYTLVGEENFRALIVTPDDIKSVSSPIKGTELNEKAKQLWALLRSDEYDTTKLSTQIYNVVFKPIEAQLPKDTTTIMWSLDGNLRYVPMAALFDGEKFLIERYNHVVFTRADKERMMRDVSPVWIGTGFGSTKRQTGLLLGDQLNFKALPGVDAELKGIFKTKDVKSGILEGEILIDGKFNQASLLAALKLKRPLVHIASHFSFRPGDETRSFLLLGDGTAFTLAELKKQTDVFAGVDLLTLSACNTAAQRSDATGKEIDGFAELAQRLGAGAVMATLWPVADNSTPWLMRGFYATRQNKTGITKAEALRQAQISLLNGTAKTKPLPYAEKGASPTKLQIEIVPKGKKRDGYQVRDTTFYIAEEDAPLYNKTGKPPFAHPYYWSPFVLFGNWR